MAARKNQTKARLEADRRKAFRKFRPRKNERLSYVFIRKNGARVSPGFRDKVYAVYVTRNGRAVPVRPKGLRGSLSGLKPHRISTIQVAESYPRKIAARKLLAVVSAKRGGEPVALTVRPGKGRRVVDYDKGARKLAAKLSRELSEIDPRSKRVFQITISGTFRLPDGRLKTIHTIPVEFGAAFLQQYTPAQLQAFARQKIWALLGNELDLGMYVTTGSAAFIRARSYNRGKPPSQWRQKMAKGELVQWRYASDYGQREKVQLVQLDYQMVLE